MKLEAEIYAVSKLIDLRQNNMLAPNPEYQRGAVWRAPQKKRLIDSILRGYPISVIYLHHIHREVGGLSRDDLEIIDGQQRIDAICEFADGAFKLFDPAKDAVQARFPNFIREAPCPWGGKNFSSMDESTRQQFLGTPLAVGVIHSDNLNEPRDLFIRLQAGMPLNPQEKRDAWPGGLTDFILKIAGKPEIPKYPGHEFFPELMRAGQGIDRGKFRQLAAQMMMLFMARRESHGEKLCDIKADSIDNFYYEHIDFDCNSPEADRFQQILDKIRFLLGDRRKKLQGHEAIHLVLLLDSLMGDYTRTWEEKFATAFDRFRQGVANNTKTRWSDTPGEFWLKYANLARTNADQADTIRRRHNFFCNKMYEWLEAVPKDPVRLYGPLEKEIIYYRDGGICDVCKSTVKVPWDEAEIHHRVEHVQGGRTTIENGVLVHRDCHHGL